MRFGVTPSPRQPRLKYCFEQLSIQRVEYQQVGRTTSGGWLVMWRTDGWRGALAAAVLFALCAATGVFQWLEYRVYDAATSIHTPAPLPEIAIIGIDDASLESLGNGPWSLDVYAKLIDQLSSAGAKTIVLTPSFAEPQSDRGLAYLRKMRDTMARAGDTSPLATELSRTVDEAEKALDSDARLAASIQRAGNRFPASAPPRGGRPPPAAARLCTPQRFAEPCELCDPRHIGAKPGRWDRFGGGRRWSSFGRPGRRWSPSRHSPSAAVRRRRRALLGLARGEAQSASGPKRTAGSDGASGHSHGWAARCDRLFGGDASAISRSAGRCLRIPCGVFCPGIQRQDSAAGLQGQSGTGGRDKQRAGHPVGP